MFNILFKYFVAIYKMESKTNSYGTATLLQITCKIKYLQTFLTLV